MKCYLSCRRGEEKRGSGCGFVSQRSGHWIFYASLPHSGWKDYRIGNRSQSNLLPLEMLVFLTLFHLFTIFLFLPSTPPFTLLITTLFILLSPDHSYLCTNGGASVPMPRQLRRWLQQPCLKALCVFQIWWCLAGGSQRRGQHWVKETQFEHAEKFLMIHTQCRQPGMELNCSHVALNIWSTAIIESQPGSLKGKGLWRSSRDH